MSGVFVWGELEQADASRFATVPAPLQLWRSIPFHLTPCARTTSGFSPTDTPALWREMGALPTPAGATPRCASAGNGMEHRTSGGLAAVEEENRIMMMISGRRTVAGLAAAVAVCGVGLVATRGATATASPVVARVGGAEAAQTSRAELAGYATDPVPPAVRVPAGQVLIGDFLATGVQVYRCTAAGWAFVEPAANLAGWTQRPASVATAVHFRGPSWESTDDGSVVEAKVIASSPVAGSIPQLLLQSTGNRGDGVFGHVSYLQRLATRGGTAPAGVCTEHQTTGVRYRAEYRFFTPAP
jgi:hypothetical protein